MVTSFFRFFNMTSSVGWNLMSLFVLGLVVSAFCMHLESPQIFSLESPLQWATDFFSAIIIGLHFQPISFVGETLILFFDWTCAHQARKLQDILLCVWHQNFACVRERSLGDWAWTKPSPILLSWLDIAWKTWSDTWKSQCIQVGITGDWSTISEGFSIPANRA